MQQAEIYLERSRTIGPDAAEQYLLDMVIEQYDDGTFSENMSLLCDVDVMMRCLKKEPPPSLCYLDLLLERDKPSLAGN